jgi:ribonuclease BN (tRNA processing enzyme)
LQMLGTGNASSKRLYNNNGLIHIEDHKLMIDCGYLATRSLLELGTPLEEISGIIITHVHADHIGGLEEFAFHAKYASHQKINLYVPKEIRYSLWEHSLRGGLENTSEGLYGLEDYFNVVELEVNKPLSIHPQLCVEIVRTLHVLDKPSFSLFIQNHIFYSSDIQFMPEFLLKEVVQHRNCHTILHDCHLLNHNEVHASIEQLRSLPESIQSLIYLMHYGDLFESYIGKTGLMKFIHQHQCLTFGSKGELIL